MGQIQYYYNNVFVDIKILIVGFFIIKEIRCAIAYLLKGNVSVMCFEEVVINKNAFYVIHFKLCLNLRSEIICLFKKRE